MVTSTTELLTPSRSASVLTSPWRKDFPTLQTQVYDKSLVYLDSAATAQTPTAVIERMNQFYHHEYASVHRGVHKLSANATENLEFVRSKVADFIGASAAYRQHSPESSATKGLIFTKGTTEAINLVANSYLAHNVQAGDEIIITEMEHHANIVPWQMLAERLGLIIKVWRLNAQHELDEQALQQLITQRTKLLAITHVSNVLGTVNPIKSFIEIAHQADVAVLVDGAQAVMHQRIDVHELDCDFYVFSAHKLYGPTGVGALYVKPNRLSQMQPWEGGGAMIEQVRLPTGTGFTQAPWCFEAGTPNIAGILGFGAAIDYLTSIGLVEIEKHESSLMRSLLKGLQDIDGIEIYGSSSLPTIGVVSFNLNGLHAFDVGAFLDRYGIAIRTGHLCAMPLLKTLGQSSVCRVSLGLYTDQHDVDQLIEGLCRIQGLFGERK
ncbi:cysteine sulfinate desulfinase [Photobacterium jeanii]|uniref:Cysteine desulfurase n=1 Tax=Photobacterium jeanii TaxID=858640 RepID=A0A178K968_9GAMM|nr:SufS family cysteine desulfurase [Photobacterium jeanii]OAN13274.1 cysteine sulfinate desulfinase [Photobacterium jeanii]PST90271.1 SufS family cysteine desulfurase [Photobacterium jeanii]